MTKYDSNRGRDHKDDDRKRHRSRSRNNDRESKKSKKDDEKHVANGSRPSIKLESRRSPTRHDRNESKSKSHNSIQPRSNELIAEELKKKEIVYQAKMQIQERLRELGILNPTATIVNKTTTVLKPEEAAAFTHLHMDKANRLAEIKGRVSKGLTNLNMKTPNAVIEQLAIEKSKPKIELKEPEQKPHEPVVGFLDSRLKLRPVVRQRRTFEFKKPGEYEKLANMQRSKAKLEKLQTEIAKTAKQTGISSAVKLAIVTPGGTEPVDGYIPNVEWWDEIVLGAGKSYGDLPSTDVSPLERYSDSITDLVEHPIQLKPPDEPLQPQYIKACLTKKERKKLRRQNRREALKEKMEKVRLGLEKPPEAKVKISNLMRVLGNEAIQDPTKMEAHVRKQIAERAQKHVEANENRKLTRDQKRAKMIRKIGEDTSLAVFAAVYKVKSLTNPKKRFKVLMNVKQLQMTGVVISIDDINVIVVEGGPKQQKFFKNLMMHRIKWAEEYVGQKKERELIEQNETKKKERNECTLIWEGIVQKRAFNGEIRFLPVPTHKQARELLEKHNVAHYWDLCYSTTVLLSSED